MALASPPRVQSACQLCTALLDIEVVEDIRSWSIVWRSKADRHSVRWWHRHTVLTDEVSVVAPSTAVGVNRRVRIGAIWFTKGNRTLRSTSPVRCTGVNSDLTAGVITTYRTGGVCSSICFRQSCWSVTLGDYMSVDLISATISRPLTSSGCRCEQWQSPRLQLVEVRRTRHIAHH
jgi:hypothetical protein